MNYELLDNILKAGNGVIVTARAVEAGVSKTALANYAKKNNLAKIAHGIYFCDDYWEDPYYIFSLRYKNVIFSHETALYLLGLSDREPTILTITAKDKYNCTSIKNQGTKIYRIKKELFEVGLTSIKTPMGNKVPIYDAERSLCDVFRSRNSIEVQDLVTAIKEYIRLPTKNIPKLIDYAKQFKVEKILQNYMGVLLS